MNDTSNFELLFSVTADGNIPVSKYKSKKTGISVFIAQVDGPLVNGYFCLATEAHDDDGLPHTLEHLIFLGSEDYPYKGILDLLANRCLASGTNAWTDTDHTCYTMTNAGSEGFLNLMPIYVEHILYPTLTNSGYITEVHHVNGEGDNAGVVYCEMQGRENMGESRCHLAMLRNMYPGICGYKSETGGIMKNLRESTSHVKVCNYHKQFYRPENLCLIITGQVEPKDVFAKLQSVEDKIQGKGDRDEFVRPWQSEVPPLTATVEQILPYPADEEKVGMVYAAWRGPPAKDQYKLKAIDVMENYLSDSAISPLQKFFVETEDPYCSSVSASILENFETCFYLIFKNVVFEKLGDLHGKLNEVLTTVHKGKLDMERMQSIIHRKMLEALSATEEMPHDTMAFLVIGDFLYSHTKEDLNSRLSNISMFKQMKSEGEEFWKDILEGYFVNKPHVVVIGKPSKTLMEEMAEEEKTRVEVQRKELGEEGLKKKEDQLEKATEENEKEAPESVLTCVPVPDVSKIYFHPINPSSNLDKSTENQNEKFPLAEIPFKFQLDDLNTNFVQINALLDSTAVPQELKYYLVLFCEVLFESAVQRGKELIPHEEVIKQIQADTLSTDAGLGVGGSKFSCGAYPQIVHIMIKVEQEKYEKGVELLKDILFNTKFSANRLKIVAQKLANAVASMKRKGVPVTRAILRDLLFKKDCNHTVASMLRQEQFLTSLLKELDTNAEKVVQSLEKVRQVLVLPSNMRIHLTTNVNSLVKEITTPQLPWQQFSSQAVNQESGSSMDKTYKYILPIESSPHKRVIIGVGSVESSFLIQAVESVHHFEHDDLPAIMVFIQYVTQLEGPMWRQIRGLGLSYNYGVYVKPETGLLYFVLSKSTHIVKAYKEGRDIIMGYIKGETDISDVEFEAAKCSLIFEIIEEEKTVADVAQESILSYFREVSHDYNKNMLPKVAKVTKEDMLNAGRKYISLLFDDAKVRTAVCCNPSKVQENIAEFKELNVTLTELKSLGEEFLTKC